MDRHGHSRARARRRTDGAPLSGRSQRGAVALEFALVLPVLLLLVFGIIEFGFAYHAWDATQNAAREGARLAAVVDQVDGSGGIKDRATIVAEGASLDTSSARFSVNVRCTTSTGGTCPSPWAEGDIIRVTVSYTYDFITPLSGLVPGMGDDMSMTSVAEARFEGQ
jgi:Flp pilus assembly protein TadG